MAGIFFNNPNAVGNASAVTVIPGAGAVAINALSGSVFSFTPTATSTLTANTVPAGSEVTIFITTSGTTSYTTTFGTGFKSTGTLASGTVSGATFAIQFISNGTNLVEVGRTVAM